MLASVALAGCVADGDDEASDAMVETAIRQLSNTTTLIDGVVVDANGREVPYTIHKPDHASVDAPVPIVIDVGGGFGASRNRGVDGDGNPTNPYEEYVAAGFGVVTFDYVGHGDSRMDSQFRGQWMDDDVPRVQAVMDLMAEQEWVLLDGPGDPVIALQGTSAASVMTLLTALIDDRVDAISPDMPFADINRVLVPNGVPRTEWFTLLTGLGTALVNVDPRVQQAYAQTMSTNRMPDGSMPGEEDWVAILSSSSLVDLDGALDVPTLIVQGANDTIATPIEGWTVHRRVEATGAPVSIMTYFGGHMLPNDGNEGPEQTSETANQGVLGRVGGQSGPSPCGDIAERRIQWFSHYLLDIQVDTGPKMCFALDNESSIVVDDWPQPQPVLDEQPEWIVPMGEPAPASMIEIEVSEGTAIAGIPTIRGNLTGTSESIVFWTIERRIDGREVDEVANYQITPMRIPAGSHSFELDMVGIGLRIEPGETLLLVVHNHYDQYLSSQGREPGVTTIHDVQLSLPIIEE